MSKILRTTSLSAAIAGSSIWIPFDNVLAARRIALCPGRDAAGLGGRDETGMGGRDAAGLGGRLGPDYAPWPKPS